MIREDGNEKAAASRKKKFKEMGSGMQGEKRHGWEKFVASMKRRYDRRNREKEGEERQGLKHPLTKLFFVKFK